uniref:Leucine rich repeat-containing protein n=1 Tax=Trepomonas sp. PC1 TaxID=1076344 RepID=A0A146KBT1_9EUKA|eukprot:JAP93374.1 Hypothetical protein TPC1_14375 [Trepomonas sp. PC1]
MNYLQVLDVSHNSLNSLKFLRSTQQLLSLNISHNHLQNPDELRYLMHPMDLQTLDMRQNKFAIDDTFRHKLLYSVNSQIKELFLDERLDFDQQTIYDVQQLPSEFQLFNEYQTAMAYEGYRFYVFQNQQSQLQQRNSALDQQIQLLRQQLQDVKSETNKLKKSVSNAQDIFQVLTEQKEVNELRLLREVEKHQHIVNRMMSDAYK